MHCSRVPNRVRRYAAFGQTAVHLGCPGHGDVQTLVDVGACHRPAVAIWQQGRAAAQRWVAAQPGTDLLNRSLPQGHRTLLPALAAKVNARAAIQNHVGYAYADDLRDPCPGVLEHGQQQMIALRSPGTTWL